MKRALLIVGLALLIEADGHTQSVGPQWTCSLDAVLDTQTVCTVAPEPGMRRYVTDIVAQSIEVNAGVFGLFTGTGTACATGNLLFLPEGQNTKRFAAAASTSAPTVISFSPPVVVPSGKDLCLEGDATNGVTVQITGYTAP